MGSRGAENGKRSGQGCCISHGPTGKSSPRGRRNTRRPARRRLEAKEVHATSQIQQEIPSRNRAPGLEGEGRRTGIKGMPGRDLRREFGRVSEAWAGSLCGVGAASRGCRAGRDGPYRTYRSHGTYMACSPVSRVTHLSTSPRASSAGMPSRPRACSRAVLIPASNSISRAICSSEASSGSLESKSMTISRSLIG